MSVNRHIWPHLIQNIIRFVQQNSPELGGGFVGVILHGSSNAVNVPEEVLQQPAGHMTVTRIPVRCARTCTCTHAHTL